MTVTICYDVSQARLPDGSRGLRITRKSNVSCISILLTAKDALKMVEKYRYRECGRFHGVDGLGEIYIDMADHEFFTLYWSKKGDCAEDDLWSDWPDAFMTEIEDAAREASA